jgi:hypothetical protein
VTIRIYNTVTDTQIDAKVMLNNLTDGEMGERVKQRRSEFSEGDKNCPQILINFS